MKNHITVFVLLLSILVSCGFAQSGAGYQSVEPQAFKSLLAEKGGTLIDVRTSTEVERGKIPQAMNIDWLGGSFDSQVASMDKSKPLFVYCAVGGRSYKAMEKLKSLGFQEVYDLKGGIKAWQASGFTLEQ